MHDADPDIRVHYGGRPGNVLFGSCAFRMIRRAGFLVQLCGRVRQFMRTALGLGSVKTLRLDPQPFGQVFVKVRAFIATRLDGGQHLPCRVYGLQNERY